MTPNQTGSAGAHTFCEAEQSMARALASWPGRTLIATHLRPDGDAIGAAFGLAHCLRGAGHEAYCIAVDPISAIYEFLAKAAPPRIAGSDLEVRPGDRLVVVDAGDQSRLPDEIKHLCAGTVPMLCIDHHEKTGGFPGAMTLVEPDAGSASEIVFRVCEKAGFPVSRDAAEAFWTGIVTDTGRFGYTSTSCDTLQAASRLVALGVRVQMISEAVYGTVPLRRVMLQKRFLENLEVLAGGAVVIGSLSAVDYETEGCDATDSENFVDIARSVSGCKIAAFVRQVKPSRPVNISLRGAEPIDVASLCAEWGGGGHRAAAGATLEQPLPDALQIVRTRLCLAIQECLSTN